MGELLWAVVATFFTSMIPGLELRVGIPTGLALGLSTPVAVGVAIAGNLLQIQIAWWAVGWAYRHAKGWPRMQQWLNKTEGQVKLRQGLIRRWGWVGLAAFVLLPLPGTGVWGGVILARILHLSGATVWTGVSMGIAASGILFGLGAHGTFSLLRNFI